MNGYRGVANNASLVARTMVTKTHITNVEQLQAMFGSYFDHIFLVGNERKDQNKFLPQDYCANGTNHNHNKTFPNVLCLEYNDLQYHDETTLRQVVKYVKDQIRTSFSYYFGKVPLHEEEAVQRLLDMAESYKGTPGYNPNRYGIGGGNAKNHTL